MVIIRMARTCNISNFLGDYVGIDVEINQICWIWMFNVFFLNGFLVFFTNSLPRGALIKIKKKWRSFFVVIIFVKSVWCRWYSFEINNTPKTNYDRFAVHLCELKNKNKSKLRHLRSWNTKISTHTKKGGWLKSNFFLNYDVYV